MPRKDPEARREYKRKYREANREANREYMRKYYAANREARLESKREYRKANPEKWRASLRKSSRKRRYNLTHEQFEAMRIEQDNCCAICGVTFDDMVRKLTPCVDHSHKTGKVRALLCFFCNSAIGKLNDSPERCVQAANYLRLHGG